MFAQTSYSGIRCQGLSSIAMVRSGWVVVFLLNMSLLLTLIVCKLNMVQGDLQVTVCLTIDNGLSWDMVFPGAAQEAVGVQAHVCVALPCSYVQLSSNVVGP